MNTPHGDEFVCGQLVETSYGTKFVPGQVITLKNGEMKFVPGVTDRSTGKFVPGQIIETRGWHASSRLLAKYISNFISLSLNFQYQKLGPHSYRARFATQVHAII